MMSNIWVILFYIPADLLINFKRVMKLMVVLEPDLHFGCGTISFVFGNLLYLSYLQYETYYQR